MPHSCDQIEGADWVLLGKLYLLNILIVFSVAGRIFGGDCDAKNSIPEVSYTAERGIANQLPSENSIAHLNRCEECAY